MRVWKTIAISLMVLAMLFTSACNPFAGNPLDGIQKGTVTRGDMIIKVNGSGKTTVGTDAKLTFGTGGKIAKLYVKKGDLVKKDMVLGKLETDSLELAVLQVETAEAQAEVAQAQAQNAVAQAQTAVAQTQTALAQAEVALEAARFELDRMKEVDDIKKKIIAADQRLTIAQEGMKAASLGNDIATNQYWQRQIQQAVKEKADAQKELSDLLSTERFKTLIIGSMTVPEAAIKQLQVEAAQRGVEQAKLTVDQANLNVEQVTLTVEQTRRSVAQAKKAVDVAKKQLADATIIAPFEGVVASLDVKEGDIIPPPTLATTPVIYLIDPATMEMTVDVDEIDIPNVKLDQKAIISLDAQPEVKMESKVTYISLVPKLQSGVVVYEVTVAFAVAPVTGLRSGMSAAVDIIVNEHKNVLQVPSRAILAGAGNNDFVEVVVNQTIEKRAVMTGLSDDINTEIVSGLAEGEVVVTRKPS